MAWDDRLLQAAYTTPAGSRLLFSYEDVSREQERKGTAFEFAGADGTYVQSKGVTGRRYPLRVFFSGSDHDTQADEFFLALAEPGVGVLDHPRYGIVDVIPLGKIAQRDDLKTAANQTVIQLTFFDTIGVEYPTGQASPAAQVREAVAEFNSAASAEFADTLVLDTAGQRATFRNNYNSVLGGVTSTMGDIADAQTDVRQQFYAIANSITSGIDILISIPETLGAQTLALIQTPALAAVSVSARLSSFSRLIDEITAGDSIGPNEFRTEDLYSQGYVSGSIVSVVNTEFETKTDAIQAAEDVLEQFSAVVAWKDENLQSLDLIDTGGAYQQLQEAVSICAGFLIELSFSLKQERSIVLDRDRTMIDLCAELYDAVDSELDFFARTNSLSGDEYLEIKRGREIVYYV